MRKNILVTPLMAVLAASALYSQDTDGTITGRVTGPDNKPLQGVRVSITSPSLLTPRTARTDANGSFRVPILPPGQYSLVYSIDGYLSRRSSVSLVAGTTVNASTKLQSITAQSATVEITASGSSQEFIQIDKTDTTVQTVFTSERMNEIVGTAVADIAKLTPGVQGDMTSQYGNYPNFMIRGSFVRGIKTIQDGQVINDALWGTSSLGSLSVEDTIESVAIVQSPLNAKLGDSDGALISITTKKGTNDFSGSLRWSGNRNTLWTGRYARRANRWGILPDESGVGNDNLSKTWDFTLRGPIVPGYLTFSYAGTIRPSTRSIGYFNTSTAGGGPGFTTEWNPNPTTPVWSGDANRRVGTWYQSPNGDIIRKADWWSITDWNSSYSMTRSAEGNINSFNLYLQITEGHTLSYYYQQSSSEEITNGAYDMGEASDEYGRKTTARNWNFAYKGILGAYGVLDARYGNASSFRDRPKARGGISVRNRFWATYFDKDGYTPDDPRANSANFDNYAASGIIDAMWGRWNSTTEPWYNTRSRVSGDAWFYTIGYNGTAGDGSDNKTMSVNYSHILDFFGSHMIDIGFNRTVVAAPAESDEAPYLFDPVGQIDRFLTQAQITNINGNSAGAYTNYAGRYIVFNVGNSTIGSLEPQALRANWNGGSALTDLLFWDSSRGARLAGLHPMMQASATFQHMNETVLLSYLPTMRVKVRQANGSASGQLYTTTGGYYVNDMWTINPNHSIMLGVRADSFEFGDSTQTVHKYTKFTPRFEYKFDPFGDQVHLFALSYAQFHQMANAALYWPFLDVPYNAEKTMLWSVGAPGYQAVTLSDLTNPDNYQILYSETANSSMDNKLDPGFKPPTSKEISIWYRRSFTNGGTWKISYSTRTWDDLYDYFMGEPYQYGSGIRRATVLRNTKDFERRYQGVELQWDAPINRTIAFGGHYTYSRFKSNQSAWGSSSTAPNSTTSRIPWQWPEYWDARYNWLLTREAADSAGVYNPGTNAWFFPTSEGFGVGGYGLNAPWKSGRDMWAPMLSSGNEYNLYWYLTLNLSQGKVRTTLSLSGSFTGASELYDTIPVGMGMPYIPGLNSLAGVWGGAQIGTNPNNSTMTAMGGTHPQGHIVVVNSFTGTSSMSTGDLRYTMSMPIVRKLSWTIQGNISNLFNHFYKQYSAPKTQGNANPAVDFITPGPITIDNRGGSTYAAVPYAAGLINTNLDAYLYKNGPFFAQRDDWQLGSSLSNYYGPRNIGGSVRYITLSTGLRF